MKRLKQFLTDIELIGLVIIISVYHYYQALAAHDPVLVAGVIAVFVDLLHYKTIERAIGRGRGWWLAGLFTTALAFSLQFAFYSQQFTYWHFEAWLFSSIIPFGVALWAIMQGSDERSAWHQKYDELRSRANERVAELRSELEVAVNGRDEAVKLHEALLKQHEDTVNQYEAELNASENKLQDAESKIKWYESIHKAMNPLHRDIAEMMAFKNTTQTELAEKYGVSTGYVSGIKTKMNGHK